ncbi:membrane protein [Escherichia coli O118:H16 str. 07-4255]|nr:membrane protein [Escherichia coli O118:H16 str. 07-4255]
MALVWLVIGFGMELFFLADRVHSALRVIVGLGMLFLMIMIAGGMCGSLLSRKKTS